MFYGVSIARRGWLEKVDVANTLEVKQLMKRLKLSGRNERDNLTVHPERRNVPTTFLNIFKILLGISIPLLVERIRGKPSNDVFDLRNLSTVLSILIAYYEVILFLYFTLQTDEHVIFFFPDRHSYCTNIGTYRRRCSIHPVKRIVQETSSFSTL